MWICIMARMQSLGLVCPIKEHRTLSKKLITRMYFFTGTARVITVGIAQLQYKALNSLTSLCHFHGYFVQGISEEMRPEAWKFLLRVYAFSSSREERAAHEVGMR